jgi:hypothetical protein
MVSLEDGCLAYVKNGFKDVTRCDITYQPIWSIASSEVYGGCPTCNRRSRGKAYSIKCLDGWWVCSSCYPERCNVCIERKPELVEAKVGKITWKS